VFIHVYGICLTFKKFLKSVYTGNKLANIEKPEAKVRPVICLLNKSSRGKSRNCCKSINRKSFIIREIIFSEFLHVTWTIFAMWLFSISRPSYLLNSWVIATYGFSCIFKLHNVQITLLAMKKL